MPRSLFALAAAFSLLALALPAAAAAAPSNDNFAAATAIDPSALPFNDSVQIDQASTESGEPQPYCAVNMAQTIWYAVTPTSSGVMRVSDSSAFYYQFIAAYRQDGTDISGLLNVACASWAYGTNGMTFNVDAGKTYYIQAGASFFSAGTLSVAINVVPPPANDNFANATSLTSVPFSDSVDTTAATVEQGEPAPTCGYGQSAGTVWYAFTPSVTGSYSASIPWPGFSVQDAVYTGSSLTNLSEIACQPFNSPLTFHANAGTTYYLQAGGLFGNRGTFTFTLDVAPQPVVNIYYSPSDPSIFDTMQFADGSYDPAGVGIASESWSFGDGGAASGCCPTHRYGADGDYAVKLTVTTGDGRTASKTQTIHVQTHDVSIAKLMVPQTASAGQTRSTSVGIADTRYPETVQVELFKNDVVVGTLTQSVPVRTGGRTTTFGFTYTFTKDDAALGKVTFKAVASIVGVRDALPSDNTAVALPTYVNG
jgi:hypothetical protein